MIDLAPVLLDFYTDLIGCPYAASVLVAHLLDSLLEEVP